MCFLFGERAELLGLISSLLLRHGTFGDDVTTHFDRLCLVVAGYREMCDIYRTPNETQKTLTVNQK